jgi:dolichyl-phosphooligosaccharide-protein glycotransferase
MDWNGYLSKYTLHLTIIFLAILSIITLWIRLLPLIQLGTNDILNIVGSDDPLYNLRLIDLTVRHFPGFAWFDPMTYYPYANTTPWGPLLTWISASFCLLFGASTRDSIIQFSLMIPPILAVVMIPVIFILVQKIADWKAGIIAAIFIATISGQYFFRSLFGYLDHHIAEVLFLTIFIVFYIITLQYCRTHPISFGKGDTLKWPILLSAATGVTYVIGLANMPTMILAGLIVSIFTLFQFIWNFYRERSSEYLVLMNVVIFAIAIIGSFVIGIQVSGFRFEQYSIAHPFSYLLLIGGTIVLYALVKVLSGKQKYYYPLSIITIAVVGLLVLFGLFPEIFNNLVYGLSAFFLQDPYFLTIQEARSWSVAEAWETFNWSLILMAIGFVILIYWLWKDKRDEHLIVLIWSVLILYATSQHIRYEYYLAVNIAILAATGIGFVIGYSMKDIKAIFSQNPPVEVKDREPDQKPSKKGEAGKKADQKQKKTAPKAKKPAGQANYLNVALLAVVLLFAALFIGSSVNSEYQVASIGAIRMNPDWRESLEWMNTHTPETGVDYYTLYDKDTFTYPNQSYGVMSWWDYGHMITYIAQRIPNANPFQEGAGGPNSASTFFITQSEETADSVLDTLGTRYIITDIEMDMAKFWAMATWYNTTLGVSPYQQIFLVPGQTDPNSLEAVTLYTPAYYQTMISRLHNFDGSLVAPGQVYYVEYTLPEYARQNYPVISGVQQMNATAAKVAAANYNSQAPVGKRAGVFGTTILDPVDMIPALHHYRLVHESPRNVISGNGPDLKYVKTFEYVPGARIRGEGVIELPLVSNTGREFIYRQASANGEFIVPYATTGNPYDVRATGKYRIAGTNSEFDVSEDAVRNGVQIN